MYSPHLVDTLNSIAARYRGVILSAVRAVLSQPRYSNTGQSLASVQVEVIAGTSTTAPQIVIKFDESLVFLGLKKMAWVKFPNVKRLMEWAQTKKADPQEAKRLAWAVAWSQKKNDTWRPKAWRKQSLSQVLKEMNALILVEFDKAIEAQLAEATKI
jgi:hypothetical protein